MWGETMTQNEQRYNGLDGLKAFAILGIVLMHVLSNGKYELGGFVFEQLIPAFTNLVFLFMMVSGFGMCCGYYQKIIDRRISMEEFYLKRYAKIWPFFALLCVVDLALSPSAASLYEVFANLTLCQGLLPNANISVIGVSWTLAVIFVFYLLFPFFCFLLGNKRRAWGVAVVALVFNFLCGSYFNAGRTNILYDGVYFVAGGLIYLYRKPLADFAAKHRVWMTAAFCAAVAAYFAMGASTPTLLAVAATALINTIGNNWGGYWRTLLQSFLAASASKCICAIWSFIACLKNSAWLPCWAVDWPPIFSPLCW